MSRCHWPMREVLDSCTSRSRSACTCNLLGGSRRVLSTFRPVASPIRQCVCHISRGGHASCIEDQGLVQYLGRTSEGTANLHNVPRMLFRGSRPGTSHQPRMHSKPCRGFLSTGCLIVDVGQRSGTMAQQVDPSMHYHSVS